jgi:hypothetical protein
MKPGMQAARIEAQPGIFAPGLRGIRMIHPGVAHEKKIFVVHIQYLLNYVLSRDRIYRIIINFFACGEGPFGRRPHYPHDPVDPVQLFSLK